MGTTLASGVIHAFRVENTNHEREVVMRLLANPSVDASEDRIMTKHE